jgi:hypothetical protein
MEWTVQGEDGFEIGEVIDDSGIMRKTIIYLPVGAFIMWCPTIRHEMLQPWLGHPGA